MLRHCGEDGLSLAAMLKRMRHSLLFAQSSGLRLGSAVVALTLVSLAPAGQRHRKHRTEALVAPKEKKSEEPKALMPNPEALNAKTAVIIDADTGRVLWSKDALKPMYPASTTKVMTGLLLIEHCTPNEVITAPKDIKNVGEASMHLQPSERVSMRNLLWAIMLRSANDGCYAAAMHVGGSIPSFAKMMNDRAAQLGCKNTHFANANGLHDKNHWTCAYDLALMGREAMKNPLFAETVRTFKYKIARELNQKDLWMVNHNKLLKNDPTTDGIKTGYTVPAGHTFVGSATRNGQRIITALMKSDHWQLDQEAMLNWAYANFDHKTIAHKGDAAGEVAIDGGTAPSVKAVLQADVLDCVQKGTASGLKGSFQPAKLELPVKEGQVVGNMMYTDSTGFTLRVPAIAATSVDRATPLARVTGRSPSFYIVGSSLGLGLIWYRSRSRRSRYYGKSTPKSKLTPF